MYLKQQRLGTEPQALRTLHIFCFAFLRCTPGKERPGIALCSLRSIPIAMRISQARKRYGSSPFSIAVWIREKITVLSLVLLDMLANRTFFCFITNGLMPRSMPSSRSFSEDAQAPLAYLLFPMQWDERRADSR